MTRVSCVTSARRWSSHERFKHQTSRSRRGIGVKSAIQAFMRHRRRSCSQANPVGSAQHHCSRMVAPHGQSSRPTSHESAKTQGNTADPRRQYPMSSESGLSLEQVDHRDAQACLAQKSTSRSPIPSSPSHPCSALVEASMSIPAGSCPRGTWICRLGEGGFDGRLDLVNGVRRLFVPWCVGHEASSGGRTGAWTARPHA
jgi:hypothetical protein